MTAGRDVVVGGGLGGLSAALRLARAGRQVVLVERSSELGGRAITQVDADFRINLGAHAMYPNAARLLTELGVRWTGAEPAARGFAVRDETLHTLPVGLVSMLTTGLLGLGDKLDVARLLASLPKLDAARYDSTSVRAWAEQTLAGERARAFVEALVRVTTYASSPAHQSAGHAIRLLQQVLRTNVTYIDGGWQVLVDALRTAAESAGVRIVNNARAVGIDRQGHDVRGARLEDGSSLPAEHVVIATSPAVAARLSGSTSLAAWAARAKPAKAACLDVALSALPRPRSTFALGIDRPTYFSVHSAAARLAPEGGALVHVAKYLDPDDQHDAASDRAELEALADRVQPGWRDHVVHARFLPALVVTHAIPLAAEGGVSGRPEPVVADAPGVLVVGDWVGRGHLAEASLLSAKRACASIAGAEVEAAAA